MFRSLHFTPAIRIQQQDRLKSYEEMERSLPLPRVPDLWTICAMMWNCNRNEAKHRGFAFLYGARDSESFLIQRVMDNYYEWIHYKPDDPYECIGGEA